MNKLVQMFSILLLLVASTGLAQAGDPMKGKVLYEPRCSGCHGLDGKPQVAEIPNFKMGQGLMKSDQQLLAFIQKGKGVMPGFKGILTETEIRDIIAHLRTFF